MLLPLDVFSLSVCIVIVNPNAYDFMNPGVCTDCVP